MRLRFLRKARTNANSRHGCRRSNAITRGVLPVDLETGHTWGELTAAAPKAGVRFRSQVNQVRVGLVSGRCAFRKRA